MGFEFELKYRASAQAQQALLQQYSHLQWQTYQMETAYFDTPTGTLAARKITLRCRRENGVPVCTVKTPAGDLGRGEWELSGCDDIGSAIDRLCAMGAPAELAALCADRLQNICGAQFTRQAACIRDGSTVLELALDAGFLFSGENRTPLCEVEVELKQGEPGDAQRWAAALAEAFGLVPEHKSKFRRALALWEEQHG